MTDERERGPYGQNDEGAVIKLAAPAEDISKVPFGIRIGRVMDAMAFLEKDGRNESQNYNFLSEANVKAHFNRALRDNHLYLSSVGIGVVEVHNEKDEGRKGRTQTVVTGVQIAIADAHSEKVCVWGGLGGGSDRGDKAAMKANTAAFKYAVTNGCVVSTGDDPESDASTDLQTPEAVVAAINAAKNEKHLTSIRSAVLALKGSADYDKVKDAYNTRLEALK